MRINNMLVDVMLQREKDHRLTPEKPLRLPLLKEVTEFHLMTRDQQIREGNHIEGTRVFLVILWLHLEGIGRRHHQLKKTKDGGNRNTGDYFHRTWSE